jgi:hypothetical protein
MMAEALAGPLWRAIAQEAAVEAGSLEFTRRQDDRMAGVPPPMIPNNTESPTTICAMQVIALIAWLFSWWRCCYCRKLFGCCCFS